MVCEDGAGSLYTVDVTRRWLTLLRHLGYPVIHCLDLLPKPHSSQGYWFSACERTMRPENKEDASALVLRVPETAHWPNCLSTLPLRRRRWVSVVNPIKTTEQFPATLAFGCVKEATQVRHRHGSGRVISYYRSWRCCDDSRKGGQPV